MVKAAQRATAQDLLDVKVLALNQAAILMEACRALIYLVMDKIKEDGR